MQSEHTRTDAHHRTLMTCPIAFATSSAGVAVPPLKRSGLSSSTRLAGMVVSLRATSRIVRETSGRPGRGHADRSPSADGWHGHSARSTKRSVAKVKLRLRLSVTLIAELRVGPKSAVRIGFVIILIIILIIIVFVILFNPRILGPLRRWDEQSPSRPTCRRRSSGEAIRRTLKVIPFSLFSLHHRRIAAAPHPIPLPVGARAMTYL